MKTWFTVVRYSDTSWHISIYTEMDGLITICML